MKKQFFDPNNQYVPYLRYFCCYIFLINISHLLTIFVILYANMNAKKMRDRFITY